MKEIYESRPISGCPGMKYDCHYLNGGRSLVLYKIIIRELVISTFVTTNVFENMATSFLLEKKMPEFLSKSVPQLKTEMAYHVLDLGSEDEEIHYKALAQLRLKTELINSRKSFRQYYLNNRDEIKTN